MPSSPLACLSNFFDSTEITKLPFGTESDALDEGAKDVKECCAKRKWKWADAS